MYQHPINIPFDIEGSKIQILYKIFHKSNVQNEPYGGE